MVKQIVGSIVEKPSKKEGKLPEFADHGCGRIKSVLV
jgi:hypothetical protein